MLYTLHRDRHSDRDRDWEMIGFCIMLCAVHTTQGQGPGPGQGPGNDGFLYYAMCCTHCTGAGTGTLTGTGKRWVSVLRYVLYTLYRGRDKPSESLFSIVPIPFPCPGSVQCV